MMSVCVYSPSPLPCRHVVVATAGREPGRVHGPYRLYLPRNPLWVNPVGEHDGRRPLQHRAQVGSSEILAKFLTLAVGREHA